MAESPRVLQFVEELWEDWETDLENWARGMETNVQDKMQDYLNRQVNSLGPPKNQGQRQFIDKVKNFIQNDIGNKESPFHKAMDRLQREQTDINIERIQESKKLEDAQKITRSFMNAQGFKIETAPNNRFVFKEVYPEIQTAEIERRGEIAREVETALREKQTELQQEQINKLIDEEQQTIDRLQTTSLDRWTGVVDDIVQQVNNAKSLNDLEGLNREIARLPINSRRLAERLVNLKRQELK